MLRRLFVAGLLFVAESALAATGSWNATALGPGGAATFTWTSTSDTGDQPAIHAPTCGAIAYSAEVTGTPAVSFFLVPTATTATASGTLIGSVSGTSRELSAEVAVGPYFVRPALSTVASGGSVTFRCAAFSRAGSGGGSVFGMVGNTATEETITYLNDVKAPQAITGITHTYWVDSLGGSDANAGTKSSPWQTLNKAKEQAGSASAGQAHVRFYLTGPFSPLVLTPTALTSGVDAGPCIVGEAATWDAGASTGTIIGAHLNGKIAVTRATGTDPGAADVITGIVSDCTRTVSTVTDTLNTGMNAMVASCENPDEACIVIGPEDPNDMVTADCNGGTAGAGQGIVRACGSIACGSGAGAVGWVVAYGLTANRCDVDNWKQVGDAKLALINVHSTNALNTSAQANQAFIAAHSGVAQWLNVSATGFSCSAGALCEILEVVNQASGLLVTNKRLAQIAAAGTAASIEFSGLDHVVVGPTIDGGDGESAGILFDESIDANDATTLSAARVVSVNNFGGVAITGDKTGTSMDAKLYQITEATGNTESLSLGFAAAVPDNSVDLLVDGWQANETTGGTFLAIGDADTVAALDQVSITNTLHNDASQIDDYNIGGTLHDTRAAAAGSAEAAAGGWTLFGGATLETAGSPTPYQWQNDAGTVTLGDFACHTEQECWKAYDATYTIALPPRLYIPAFVLGREVRAIRLNKTDGNLGAR